MLSKEQQNKQLLEIQKNSQQPTTPTAQIMFDLKRGEPIAILITSWLELETAFDEHGLLQQTILKEFGSRGMIAKAESLKHIWGVWQVSDNDSVKFEFNTQENGDNPAAQKYTWIAVTFEMMEALTDICWGCGDLYDGDPNLDGGLCEDCDA